MIPGDSGQLVRCWFHANVHGHACWHQPLPEQTTVPVHIMDQNLNIVVPRP